MQKKSIIFLFIIISLAAIISAPLIGGHEISLDAILKFDPRDPASLIFWQIRLPRAFLAWIAGAGLAVAGMVFQAMFRNDLATPDTLGVSSGASL